MSKGPTPRHSKSPKPLTIDLDATEVTPQSSAEADAKPAAEKPAGKAPAKAPGGTAKASAAEPAKPAAKTDAAADKRSGGSATKPASAGTETKSAVPTDKSAPASNTGASASVAQGAKPQTTTSKNQDQVSGQAKAETKPSGAKPAEQPAPSKRGGGLGMVASGLIGAIIALVGVYGLQTAGLLPTPGAAPDSGDQIQSLTSRLDGIVGTVDQLSGELSALPSGGETGLSAELEARLASLEAAIAQAAAASGDGGVVELGPLTDRLDALETSIATLGDSSGAVSVDPELAAAVAELEAGQSGFNAAVGELQSQSAALSDSIATLEQQQAALEARIDEPSQQIDVARAIAAAGLKTAIDRGGPFMSELEAFASVAPDDPAVPEFRDLAARGVPSRSDLMESFPEAANLAIAAANPIDPEAGLVDRLMTSALSVVKVRPVGEVEGDTTDAIVARAEARLLDGNLDAALSEWNTLPETSQKAASGFGSSLAARARAEKLIASSLTAGGLSAAPESEATEVPAN